MKRYYSLPQVNGDFIKRRDYFLLFETSLPGKENFISRIFFDPVDIIRVDNIRQVIPAFEKIEEYSKKYYLAGYFSYELGYCFGDFLPPRSIGLPLIHLGVFDKVVEFDHRSGKFNTEVRGLFHQGVGNKFQIRGLRLNFTQEQYRQKISRISKYIRLGDTYQVNFTGKYRFKLKGRAFDLYQQLKTSQDVPYGAFCKLKDERVISLSPELFFQRDGRKIWSRPMKGTIGRGRDLDEDRMMLNRLRENNKDRAENLMIVDLVRNDLGRVCRTGSVKVSDMFRIEKYQGLFQMTSAVRGTLKDNITYLDIFKNIFPGGSVTGAPKIRSMQIIRELEKGHRRIYCGALGFMGPKERSVFNLPIRTIHLRRGNGEMGLGSGIVHDSSPESEYQECLLKARFFTERRTGFYLLETLSWRNGYKYLEDHLKRLRNSALYFGYYFDKKEIDQRLKAAVDNCKQGISYRVRLLLDKQGRIITEFIKAAPADSAVKLIRISRARIDPRNVFLYHKTTNRELYDAEYAYWHNRGYFDIIYLNNKGEVTEGAISNVMIKRGRALFTPPVSSGLLPGIYRNWLIKSGKLKEKKLFLADLKAADKIFVCNSVRGMTEVRLKG